LALCFFFFSSSFFTHTPCVKLPRRPALFFFFLVFGAKYVSALREKYSALREKKKKKKISALFKKKYSKHIVIIYISNILFLIRRKCHNFMSSITLYIYTILLICYKINSYRLTVDRSSSKRSAPIRIRLAV
jgi:phosphatidylglycerophosphate synthase